MLTERYHGSATRTFFYNLFRPVSRQFRALAKGLSPKREMPAAGARLVARAKALADGEDWDAALSCMRQAASIVEREGGRGARWTVGSALVRLGDCRDGLRLMARPVPRAGSAAATWSDEDLADRTLLVLQRTKSDMGGAIRKARFIAHGLRLAARCIVVVEGRLVPLFRRTFPDAEVHAMRGRGLPPGAGEDVFVTSFEGLAAYCVTDWASVEASFVPLRADADLVAAFRDRYRAANDRMVIGITWGSKKDRKEVPDLASWAAFVRSFPATFVSLQYGSVAPALRMLRGETADRIIDDPSVDQMKDMDRFAAQVASLDGVIAISNTATHLAGALGIPTTIVGHEGFRGLYPVTTDASGWYPRSVQIRRRGRPWTAVLEEAGERLREMLAPS